MTFFALHWRNDVRGAFAVGLHHGAYCVGCCWVLMVLLFVGGVMNLIWIAALTVFVLAEKLFPMRSLFRKAWAAVFSSSCI